MFERRSEQAITPLLLTAREAAKALSISTRTLWTYTQDGTIPSVRIGGSVRYPIDALREYIARATEKK